ncbi:MAG TPA: DedA family protein [Bacteroidota bacterium]
MIEQIVAYLNAASPLLICGTVFAIAFIENIFPPSPSDLLVVFAGSLAGAGNVGFFPLLLSASMGSTLGFVVMYKIGDWFGNSILEQGKIKFIPVEAVRKVESWFQAYGYWIIVVNRFLSGTRAVVSFFAGLSELHLLRTTLLSLVSALAWNSLLIFAGYLLGHNWNDVLYYLQTYSQIITGALVIVVLILAVAFFARKKNGDRSSGKES